MPRYRQAHASPLTATCRTLAAPMSVDAQLDSRSRAGLLAAWGLGADASFAPLGHGLINQTLQVSDAGRQWVVQRLNTHVFRDPLLLMDNCRRVTAELARARAAGRYAYAVLELVPTRSGEAAAILADGSWWRMFQHVADTHAHDSADSPALAREAGRAFGAFAAALAGLEPASVGEVIPHFHDPVARFAAFRAALAADCAGRAGEAAAECAAAQAFAGSLGRWRQLRAAGLPWRIVHNDCKLNNLLFDAQEHAACVVDLDTVMPGTLLFDFGDLGRSLVSPAGEDSTRLDDITVRPDYFAALARGYIEGCGGMLTPLERDHLAFSVSLVTGVLALRFLTDWLQGDPYFRVSHRRHNLERARSQLRLHAQLDAQIDALQALVPGSA